ncbi:MAG: DUF1127 domain-containing protein [Pseudomonadota bacterium]
MKPLYSDSLPQSAQKNEQRRANLMAHVVAWCRNRLRKATKAYTALRQYDELMDMPDHMLSDMGLTRDMVRHARKQLLTTGVVEMSERARPH